MNTKFSASEVASIELALELYYSKIELTTKDVCALFGCGPTKASQLKQMASARMMELGLPRWHTGRVNTQAAYQAWSIDVDDLERRYKAMKRLGLRERRENNE